NGPAAVVVSGAEQDALSVQAIFKAMGRKTKRLNVSRAFHSPLMGPVLDDFRAVVSELSFAAPTIPLAIAGDPTDPEYWVEHVRQPVRFLDTIRALEENGVCVFLEVGPDAVLSGMIGDCVAVRETTAAVPTLRRDRDDVTALLTSLAGVWTRGGTVDWAP